MTNRTKNDLRAKIADDLTLVPIGDAIPGELSDKIDSEMQNLFEMLEDERLLIFNAQTDANEEVIPARLIQPIAELVAYNVMPSQGMARPQDPDYMISRLNRIRRSIANYTDDSTVEACYF